MSASTELLDLHVVSPHPPGVGWVDGFGGMEAVVRHLKQRPDSERSFVVTDIGHTIRAVELFTGDGLLLTNGGDVASAAIACQGPERRDIC